MRNQLWLLKISNLCAFFPLPLNDATFRRSVVRRPWQRKTDSENSAKIGDWVSPRETPREIAGCLGLPGIECSAKNGRFGPDLGRNFRSSLRPFCKCRWLSRSRSGTGGPRGRAEPHVDKVFESVRDSSNCVFSVILSFVLCQAAAIESGFLVAFCQMSLFFLCLSVCPKWKLFLKSDLRHKLWP